MSRRPPSLIAAALVLATPVVEKSRTQLRACTLTS